MADDESTNTDDTSVSEDTSTNEETQDTNLEDMEVTPEELEATEESEDSEDEKEDTEPESKEESEEDEATEETEEKSEETEEAEQSDEDKQKAFNNEMAQRRIQEKALREQNQKAQQQEYLNEADDDKDLALRQLQVDAYNNKVEGNSNKLTNGYERAVKDFEVLKDATPEIQAEIDQAIDSFQAMYVTIDAYGNPTEVRGDLYQYLKSKADSIAKLTGIREANQKTSKNKEKSKAFTPPSRAPKEPKVDDMVAAFDEEAAKP